MGPLQRIKFLGPGFNEFAYPCLLFLMVVLTITRMPERCLNFFGQKQFAFSKEHRLEMVEEGKQLILAYKRTNLANLDELTSEILNRANKNGSNGTRQIENQEPLRLNFSEKLIE